MTVAIAVAGAVGALVWWSCGALLVTWKRWGTASIDGFVWGWRSWRARRPRGLDTDTPAVYVQFFGPLPVYVGQSVNVANRFRGEGREIMALLFWFGAVVPCRAEHMNAAERALIRAFPWCRLFGFNLTDGGSKRRGVTA